VLKRTAHRMLAAASLALSVGNLGAQDVAERLSLHAALNAGYARAWTLPTFGIPLQGTSDYRAFTFQARYKLDGNDELVMQIFNRRFGTSPLASALPDVTMQWAFWQHRFENGAIKLGRSPFPRGLVNEVRYIGTLNPFFRPPLELTSDAFDAVDGVVANYHFDLGHGFSIDQYAFGGGSEFRAIATTATSVDLRIARTENLYGYQTFINVPLWNIRLGAFGDRYSFRQTTGTGHRTNLVYSGEATVDRFKFTTEHSRITGEGPSNDNRSGYFMGTFRLTDRLSLGAQKSYTKRLLYFTDTRLNTDILEVRNTGAVASVRVSPNVVLKLEHHWKTGWAWDTPTLPVASQTATAVTLSPARSGRYMILSVAASY
jgi:hypothetical protein